MSTGFGAGGFGVTPFGDGSGAVAPAPAFGIVAVAPVAENVLRLTFSAAVYYSGVGDYQDASLVSKYAVAPVAGTSGLDGSAARAVGVLSATLSSAGSVGAALYGWCVDLTLDRPMTAYPAQYSVTVNGVWSSDRSAVDPTTLPFVGVHAEIEPSAADAPRRRRDFAFPQLASQSDNGGLAFLPPSLATASPVGTYRSNGRGDYAYDEGLVGLKKRVLRRLATRPGAYAHLGKAYGVGVPQRLKKPATAALIQQIVAEAEKQIAEEPDVAKVRVTAEVNAAHNLVRFSVLVRMVGGRAVSIPAAFRAAA